MNEFNANDIYQNEVIKSTAPVSSLVFAQSLAVMVSIRHALASFAHKLT